MFWSVTIVAVRKESDQPSVDSPFGLSRRKKLIDDNLRPISKIPKLSLPKSKCIWMSLCISKLVTHNCKFREVRIGSDKPSGFSFHECIIDWVVIAVSILVENVSMSVAKSPPLNILTGNPYIKTVIDDSRKGQSFSSSPVNAFSFFNCRESLLKNFLY